MVNSKEITAILLYLYVTGSQRDGPAAAAGRRVSTVRRPAAQEQSRNDTELTEASEDEDEGDDDDGDEEQADATDPEELTADEESEPGEVSPATRRTGRTTSRREEERASRKKGNLVPVPGTVWP